MKKLIHLICLLLITFTTNAQVPSYLPTNGLIAWYPFTGNANDSSGNGNNGIVYGATLTTDRFGHAKSAYYFNGTSDSIEITDINLPIGNSSRTISIWFKMDLPLSNTWSQLIALGDNLLGERFGLTYYQASGELLVEFVNSSVGFDFTPDSSWHLLVATYPSSGTGSSSIKMYLDGSEINNLIINNPITSLNTSATASAYIIYTIGGLYSNPSYFWKGTLDDIGIWNRDLTQQEIQNIYNETNGVNTIIKPSAAVKIYPNPNNGNFIIQLQNIMQQNTQIEIFNVLGEKIYEAKLNSHNTQINLNNNAGGIYLFRVLDEQDNLIGEGKLVIE